MNINALLMESLYRKASDLHITVGVPPMLRIDGNLVPLSLPQIKAEDSEAMAAELLSKKKMEILNKYGEVDAPYIIQAKGHFRVNCYRQRGSIGIAVRTLSDKIFSLSELELPAVIETIARKKQGLILVTGPTGAGKTTTLAAMIDLINSEQEVHILTLEDPIEYYHKHKKSIITQREIGSDSTSFPSALRAALRQDPDVILVGEMRDLETVSIALTAAETGHLVLATLHTNDASKTVERIIDIFPANQQRQIRVQLANSLNGIISQRLVKRKQGIGRIAAVEILICNHAIRNLIRESRIHQIPAMLQTGTKQGMQTLDKHLQLLYDLGIISAQEGMKHAQEEKSMKEYFGLDQLV